MRKLLFFFSLFFLACAACKKEDARQPDTTYNPDVSPAKFTNSTTITNPFFPLTPGKKYIYEGQTDEGLEHVEIVRLAETKTVMGIACVVISAKEWKDGILYEDTHDWYAQDNDGNVWYFGESVDFYNPDGTLKDHHGSWEAGVDGALPGILMPANPAVGMRYRQEYYFNEAEDEAEVLATGVSVTTPFGTFEGCLKTKDFTALEPDVLEYKFYAPGIGTVKEMDVESGEEIVLIDIEE